MDNFYANASHLHCRFSILFSLLAYVYEHFFFHDKILNKKLKYQYVLLLCIDL